MSDDLKPATELEGRKFASQWERTVDARWLFLQYVEIDAPEVLEELKTAVLPLFALGEVDEASWELVPPQSEVFRSALVQWGKHFNLLDDWLLKQALQTVFLWHDADPGAGPVGREWSVFDGWPTSGSSAFFSADELRFIARWNPLGVEDRKSAKERILAELTDHLDAVEALAKNRGYQRLGPTTLKKRAEYDDYRWLIAFQVRRGTQAAIAKEAGVTEQNVSKVIRPLATVLGLSLRDQHRSGGGRAPAVDDDRIRHLLAECRGRTQ